MLRPLLLLAALCLPARQPVRAAVPVVHRTHKREARQEIAGLEQQWRAATLAGDVPVMDALLSDDYVGISMTGQVNTKAMQLERLRSRTLVLTRLDLADLKVKMVGPVAIVTGTASLTGTSEGLTMDGVFRYTRVYRRVSGGGWKITNFESTRISGAAGVRLHSWTVPPSESSKQTARQSQATSASTRREPATFKASSRRVSERVTPVRFASSGS